MKTAYLRYTIQRCCCCIKKLNCYIIGCEIRNYGSLIIQQNEASCSGFPAQEAFLCWRAEIVQQGQGISPAPWRLHLLCGDGCFQRISTLWSFAAEQGNAPSHLRPDLKFLTQRKTRMNTGFSSAHAGFDFGAREGIWTPKDKPHAPQTCASASSATLAYEVLMQSAFCNRSEVQAVSLTAQV